MQSVGEILIGYKINECCIAASITYACMLFLSICDAVSEALRESVLMIAFPPRILRAKTKRKVSTQD